MGAWGPSSDEFPLPPEAPIEIIPTQLSQLAPRKTPRSGPRRASTPVMEEAAAAARRRLASATPKKRPRRRRRHPPQDHRNYTRVPTPEFRLHQAPPAAGPPRFQGLPPTMPTSSDSAVNLICVLTQQPSGWQISPLPHSATPWMTTPGGSYSSEPASSWNDSGSGYFFATNNY